MIGCCDRDDGMKSEGELSRGQESLKRGFVAEILDNFGIVNESIMN